MKKILVFSHIPSRDDVADTLICNALSKVNMVWKYSMLGYIRDKLLFLKPDIVVMPEIRCEYTRDVVKYLHEWGVTVVQRRCEMGISAETKMDDELDRAIFGNWPVHEYIDLDICWGPKFAEMVAAHGTPKEKLIACGGIGFDQYWLPKPPVVKNTKKTVMFATGFGYADRNALYAIPEAKPGDSIHHRLVMADRQNRDNFIDLIAEFLKFGDSFFSDWDVLIRLHPGERPNYYQQRLGIKVQFAPSEPAYASLLRCDALIHTGSTMAYEAHLLNIPSLNYRNTSLDTVVGAIAPQTDTIEQTCKAFTKLELGKSNAVSHIIEKLENEYYGIVDGKAHERIADAINVLPDKTPKYPEIWPADKFQYTTPGVFAAIETWRCEACANMYNVEAGRETVKCPYCGIANVKVVVQSK